FNTYTPYRNVTGLGGLGGGIGVNSFDTTMSNQQVQRTLNQSLGMGPGYGLEYFRIQAQTEQLVEKAVSGPRLTARQAATNIAHHADLLQQAIAQTVRQHPNLASTTVNADLTRLKSDLTHALARTSIGGGDIANIQNDVNKLNNDLFNQPT